MKKTVRLSVFVLAIIQLWSCGSDNSVDLIDPLVQFEENKVEIADFFADRGIADFDTTTTGVRYAFLQNGLLGDPVQPGDKITLDYVAYVLSGNVLGTTFEAVADTSEVITTASDPLTITHTVTGWAFNELFTTQGGAFRTNGFKDGVTTIFNGGADGTVGVRVGGTALLAVPARETTVTINGATTRIQGIPSEVIIYQIQLRSRIE